MSLSILLLLLPFIETAELPRGISTSRASFYQPGRPFKCLDGSSVLHWHQVNDDYCDCIDGSDEPGTSACPNGHFFCKDTQYKQVSLRSALVNDGVCDCCDGSDEYDGRIACESTCGVLAAAVEQARLLKRQEVERGHANYKEYVAKLKVRKEEERLAAEQAERERQLIAEQTAQQANPPSESPSESHAPSSDETNETANEPVAETSTEDRVDQDIAVENDGGETADDIHEADNHSDDKSSGPEVEPPKPIDYGPEEAFRLLEELPDCLEFTDLQYTYRLCPFKDVHQRDRGSSGLGTLLGKWSGWATEQEDAPPAHKYSLMYFKDGMGCWNGPPRSVKVHVHCSDENKITDVKEPSRCEYEMHLRTSAACFDDPEAHLARFHPEL